MSGSGMSDRIPRPCRAGCWRRSGLVTTLRAVFAKPASDTCRVRAHSTDTVTSVHRSSELNTSTSDTAGSAASPSVTFASGIPSSRLLPKIPPIAKTDCADAIHREHAARDDAAEREHDERTAEIRDEQARIHRRQPREVAHQAKEQRRHRDGEHETRQRVGHGLRPARSSASARTRAPPAGRAARSARGRAESPAWFKCRLRRRAG